MKLNIQGNTPLYLPRDPVSPMEAATKSYVDVTVSSHAADYGLHLTPSQNTWIDALTASSAEVNYLVGVTSGIQSQFTGKLSLSGGTMTGTLTLDGADPVNPNEAVSKAYVDGRGNLGVSKTGDTMTGYLVLHADPVLPMQAATMQYVSNSVLGHSNSTSLHLSADQNTWIDAITVTSGEVNLLEGVTSNVQEQVNAKLPLAGGTMTGAIVLAGAPTANLNPATKKYTDDADALKLDLAGGTMTGTLVLAADPTAGAQAATKVYVDTTVQTHATSTDLHVTPAQNTWLDAITVTSAEINHLAGVTSDVQTQLNAKFDKTGGEITGDVTLATGKGVFVTKTPETGNELVNKAYVDAKVLGQEWKDPITASNLVREALSSPPISPVKGDTYIVGPVATDAWVGLEGYAVTYNGTTWVSLQGRAVAVNDRFGVAFTSVTAAAGGVAAHSGKIVTLASVVGSVYTWVAQDITAGSATLVFDPQSTDFGVTYTFTDESSWVATNASVNFEAGDGLELSGNLLSVKTGAGIQIVDDKVTVKLDAATSLSTNVEGEVTLGINTATLQVTAGKLTLATAISENIADAVTKSGNTEVTGKVTFLTGADLVLTDAPVAGTDAVNKAYVDAADLVHTNALTALDGRIDDLELDSVTKEFVNTEVAKKVSKAGDTMTGYLTLSGAPTATGHAATKGYVDTEVSTHAEDTTLHVSPTQKTFLNDITVTASEINTLDDVTGNVQAQIDARLKKAGDTMTGELILSGNAVSALGAVTKQQVESGLGDKVAKAGDTMTGFLTLSGTPTADEHASTKKYVDDGLSTHVNNAGVHLSESQNTWIDAITATSEEINYLAGVTSGVQAQFSGKLALVGGTMTGAIVLHADPSADSHAANKKYVDEADALKLNLTGGTMTGALVLPGDPTADGQAARKAYVDSQVADAKSYADGNVDMKVAKAGDTMTGFLTLHAAPTSDMHTANKKYVDQGLATLRLDVDDDLGDVEIITTGLRSDVDTLKVDPVTKSYVDTQDGTKLPKAGGTLTGYVTLHAEPISPMHPASKQYVDAVAQGLITKPSVRFATTENIAGNYQNGTFGVNSTITGSIDGALLVDGGVPATGDRILVRLQTNQAENGDYVVQQTGDVSSPYILKRVTLVDESHEVPGSYYYVFDGATLKGTGWVFTVDNPVTFAIGVDNIAVNQFSGQGSIIAGDGMLLDGNTMNVATAAPSRIVINADSIDLAVTGVTPGTYTKTVVDGYGRVTSGVNPNTLAGYGIADAQTLNANLTSLSLVETTGFVVRTSTNDIETRKLAVSGVGLEISNNGSGPTGTDITISTNATASAGYSTVVARDASGNFAANTITAALDGNATTATTLKTARDISATGDITATAVSFNGSDAVELVTALSNTGITAGTYTKVTVDAKGRLSAGTNPTTLEGYGIIDAATLEYVNGEIADLRSLVMELQAYVMARM